MQFERLDLERLTDKEVLFFIRIRGKKSYFKLVYTHSFLSLFKSIRHFKCISEYKKDADVYIDLNAVDRDFLYEAEDKKFVEIIDLMDVISRCRGLRSVPLVMSKKLVIRAYLFFENYFSVNKDLKLVVCGTVDNYVMDVMTKVGENYGVSFLGVTDSFMSPQYKLISLRGEASGFRDVSDEEVLRVYEQLKNRALSPIVPNRKKAIMGAVYDFASYVYRSTYRYLILYKCFNRLNYDYIFAPTNVKLHSISQILAIRFLKSKKHLINAERRTYAYIPLHYYPEATTDYWIKDKYHVDYESSVINAVSVLQAVGYTVVIKEHPSFYLARSARFYKALADRGCIILTPFISTKEIFSNIHLVVVWNGSSGIEAIVNDKPVVRVTNSYYGDLIIPWLSEYEKAGVMGEEARLNVVKKVLSSSFRTF